jgi:hypothetical protein
MKTVKPDVNDLQEFMCERHSIYLRRASGLPAPWTEDPILSQYKFCNIFRELDRTTVWIRKHVREPFADHEHLWFMVVLARFFNRADCLEYLIQKAWPADDRWSAKKCLRVLSSYAASGNPVLNPNAYQVYAHNVAGTSKLEFILNNTIRSIWKDRKKIARELETCSSCAYANSIFKRYEGIGSFLSAQFIYDLMYTRYLIHATDRDTWAGCGKGSMRGLNRILQLPIERKVGSLNIAGDHEIRAAQLIEIRSKIRWPNKWPKLSLRDVENILCEFSKYERAKEGGHLQSYKPKHS